jgi:hypothetical protein
MRDGLTVKRKFSVQNERRGRKTIHCGNIPDPPLVAGVPRVAKLMALAIHFDQLLRDGVVVDQAELARLGHVSRARLTQIMNLLNLAPDIQEDLLHLSSAGPGRSTIAERNLRGITTMNWQRQRRIWLSIRPKS